MDKRQTLCAGRCTCMWWLTKRRLSCWPNLYIGLLILMIESSAKTNHSAVSSTPRMASEPCIYGHWWSRWDFSICRSLRTIMIWRAMHRIWWQYYITRAYMWRPFLYPWIWTWCHAIFRWSRPPPPPRRRRHHVIQHVSRSTRTFISLTSSWHSRHQLYRSYYRPLTMSGSERVGFLPSRVRFHRLEGWKDRIRILRDGSRIRIPHRRGPAPWFIVATVGGAMAWSLLVLTLHLMVLSSMRK